RLFMSSLLLILMNEEADSIGRLAHNLRCRCINTSSVFIHPKYMKMLEVIPSGPHCENTEIIATVLDGRQTCLNPETRWMKRMLNRIEQRPCTVCLFTPRHTDLYGLEKGVG
ncbi:interleukin-8-like, partial [Amblyraja radiata]|uniref:interleukin-8-like n=1 Tax=Amblyraja radiata TaxID=386614 RepID=UPI001403FDC9